MDSRPGRAHRRRSVRPSTSRGDPLPPALAGSLGTAMDADFQAIRVHTDAQSTSDLDATAFTSGNDLTFRPGAYQPDTPTGVRLIAHELAHVVQQSEGLAPAGVDRGSRDPLERDADRLASAASDGRAPVPRNGYAPGRISNNAIQRQQAKPDSPVKETREEEMEKTLSDAGQSDLTTWLGGLQTVTFLDATSFRVRPELGDRLNRAATRLKGETPPAAGWVKGGVSALRAPGSGLHGFGLAIDFRVRGNPYIFASAHPSVDAKGTQNDFVRGVIDRAVRLVLGRPATVESFDQRPSKPAATAAAPDPFVARARASFDKIKEASDAYVTYLGLAQIGDRATLETLASALTATDPSAPTADEWVAIITADLGRMAVVGKNKEWDSAGGFVSFDPRLIEALVAEGLIWLGDDTIGGGRDIMHFDTRRVGPISRIWKNGKWTNLGGG